MYMWKICIVMAPLLGYVTPHGYLQEPPQRASMWRVGFATPHNYNDNGLNCGGVGVQFSTNGGKCGVCGDPYNAAVKQYEAGGRFATGTITRTYQPGARIVTEVKITANHRGFFEFRLCPHNNPLTPVSQACLDLNLLEVEQGGNLVTRYYIAPERGVFKVPIWLPADVTCSQCVLQWTYSAGNNWGCDAPGNCGLGKGPQEHFVNCADIAISGSAGPQPITVAPPATHAPTPAPTTPAPATQSPPGTTIDYSTCRAVGAWAVLPPMITWCRTNCVMGYCPPSHCTCDGVNPIHSTCIAVGAYARVPTMSEWCNSNCNHNPPNCPPSHCRCS